MSDSLILASASNRATSLCDRCRAPGSCRSGFVLSMYGSSSPADIAKFIEMNDLPFVLMLEQHPLYSDGVGIYKCTKLGADGRCKIYETRPRTCRDFAEGGDPLCAEYVHRIRGIAIVAQKENAT